MTIVATGLENLLVRARRADPGGSRYRPIFAGVFGLVHGAGFANYLHSLFTGSIAVPLLGFNLGIELGQLVILAVAAVALAGMDRVVGLRRRVVAVSAAVVVLAVPDGAGAHAVVAGGWLLAVLLGLSPCARIPRTPPRRSWSSGPTPCTSRSASSRTTSPRPARSSRTWRNDSNCRMAAAGQWYCGALAPSAKATSW